MAIDTGFGQVRKFEDFLVTALADLPEIDTMAPSGTANAVVAGGLGGRIRMVQDGTDDNDVAALSFGDVNWKPSDDIYMEARIFISAITDYSVFVGFSDIIATGDDIQFDMAADAVTIGTDVADAFGIGYDGDATTLALWCLGAKTNAVTVSKVLSTKHNPVAATAITLGCFCSADRKSMEFYVNGVTVYRIDSATTLIGNVGLVPGVWAYDQGTACNIDVDYIYAKANRSTT